MGWLRTAWRELLALFVDDGWFAAVILAWVIAAVLGLPQVAGHPGWRGPVLFAGLAAVLAESVLRRARSRR